MPWGPTLVNTDSIDHTITSCDPPGVKLTTFWP